MIRWRCQICGYIYKSKIGDMESGIEPGVTFKQLPDRWGCPDCGAEKSFFEPYEDYEEYLQQPND